MTIEESNQKLAREADDKSLRWHKLFAAQATLEQATACLADLREITFAEDCAAYAGGFETNRVMHISGRQSVWKEIQQILSNDPKQL